MDFQTLAHLMTSKQLSKADMVFRKGILNQLQPVILGGHSTVRSLLLLWGPTLPYSGGHRVYQTVVYRFNGFQEQIGIVAVIDGLLVRARSLLCCFASL